MTAPIPAAIDFAPVIAGERRVLCCHRGRIAAESVPNSLEAVVTSIGAGASRVEVDIQFLADDTIAVFHDAVLDHETGSRGPIAALTAAGLGAVTLNAGGSIPLLRDMVDAVRGTRALLQVDLKPLLPLTPGQHAALKAALQPIAGQVLLGSRAYWSLRSFEQSGIPLAFDPTLLLCRFEGVEPPWGIHPARTGVHGFWDDHPLAHLAGVSPVEYLNARLQDLLACLPSGVEWMVNVDTLVAMAAHGFQLGHELASHGIELAAWTLTDAGSALTTALLYSLAALGTTTFITDHPVELARYAALAG